MKVKELSSILDNLDPELDVRMYLFTPCGFLPPKDECFYQPLRVDCFDINDVLISNITNSVLISSKTNI